MNATFGLGRGLALTLRRERLHAPAWYGLVALLIVLIAAGISTTYPTLASRTELVRSVAQSAGELFLVGRISSPELGAVAVWRTQGVAVILLGLASIFTIVRNTRAAEENGASEMLGSAAIGRATPLLAALVVAAGGSIAAGIVTAAGFLSIGAGAAGSGLVGLQVTEYSLFAAALAALAAQAFRTARAATGACVVVLTALYLLRGAADVTGGGLGSASPLSWVADVQPFPRPQSGMLLPLLLLSAALAGVALLVAARRDLDAGLLPERRGRSRAGRSLRGPFSLALRVSRSTIIAWSAGALLVGSLIGAISSTVDQQVDLRTAGAGTAPGLTTLALYLSPLMASILGIQTVLRLRGEVSSGRVEAVLSRPVDRARWLLSSWAAGSLAVVAFLVAFGAGLGLTGTHPLSMGTVVAAAVLRAPAAWLFVAFATVLLASVPGFATAGAYSALGLFVALEFAVEFHLVPTAVLYASPFALAPQLPDGPGHVWEALLLLAVAALFVVAAKRAIRHRDIS